MKAGRKTALCGLASGAGEGLILPQFAPTKGLWLCPKLAFPNWSGVREKMTVPGRVAQALRNGIAATAVLLWAAGSVGAALAQSQRSPAKTLSAPRQHDQELDSIRAEQRKSSEAEQRLSTENSAIADERRRLNQSLIASASRIRATEERIAAMEVRLRELETSEANIRGSLDGRRTQIAEILAALQRIGRRPPPAIYVGAHDAIESLRIAMSLESVLPQMRSEANKLQVELTALEHVKAEKAAEHTQLAADLADLAIMQRNMASLVDERQGRQAEVEQAIAAERQRAATLARQVDNLKDLIGKLEPATDGAKRSARGSTRPGDEPKAPNGVRATIATLSDPGRMAPAVAFVSAKGTLALPVSGTKIRDFGAPDASGANEKGISIATRPSAQVTAPCDGWVVYAAPYRSYGQLLILNVGGGYHVLLAGMERITVDPGQFVLTGEPVAVMGSGTRVASVSAAGSSPAIGSPQPVLYIEFRKDGTPIDSSPWWAATENEKVRG
jgi:murein hydrolase activator